MFFVVVCVCLSLISVRWCLLLYVGVRRALFVLRCLLLVVSLLLLSLLLLSFVARCLLFVVRS